MGWSHEIFQFLAKERARLGSSLKKKQQQNTKKPKKKTQQNTEKQKNKNKIPYEQYEVSSLPIGKVV